MSVSDTLQYLTLGNPISRALISSSSSIFRSLGLRPKKLPVDDMSMQPQIQPVSISMRSIIGNNYNFVRIAGLAGASAIFMGAYCKYFLKDVLDPKEQLESQAFAEVANRIHFLHSFALMCMPLAHYPVFTGVLMTMGTILFSGCMYYRALTGKRELQHYATIGGFCLIGAWLSLVV
ncbi:transmembrane protein 256 homolog [Drosophila grimshawi]|uniref:GH16289 n=1 Tax=Drosophila grimshawi TaxID=7222 RepID=B4JT11_DROGR|nr:transmembrane protein 256 homolog [Drosophila grimshawi]EDV94901.1 GH16289 [Drosophila grimshawi]